MEIRYNGVLNEETKALCSAFQTACELTAIYHRGQIDRGGTPYLYHPYTVLHYLNPETLDPAKLSNPEYLLSSPVSYHTKEEILTGICALLHDALEDTAATPEELEEQGIPKDAIDTILLLTRMPGESYQDYLDRLSVSPRAIRIKIADLTHNMDLSRITYVTVEDRLRTKKYRSARHKLRWVLSTFPASSETERYSSFASSPSSPEPRQAE